MTLSRKPEQWNLLPLILKLTAGRPPARQNQRLNCRTIAIAICTNTENREDYLQASSSRKLCFFCGNNKHPRKDYFAREAVCRFCGIVGHFSKVCRRRSRSIRNTDSIRSKSSSAFIQKDPEMLSASHTCSNARVLCNVKINGILAFSLMDTGSSDWFINRKFVVKHSLPIQKSPSLKLLFECR